MSTDERVDEARKQFIDRRTSLFRMILEAAHEVGITIDCCQVDQGLLARAWVYQDEILERLATATQVTDMATHLQLPILKIQDEAGYRRYYLAGICPLGYRVEVELLGGTS